MKQWIAALVACAMVFGMVPAFAAGAEVLVTFDGLNDRSEVNVVPGSGLKLDTISLDDKLNHTPDAQNGKSLQIAGRTGMDYRVKFPGLIKDLTVGKTYYISLWATVNDASIVDAGYFYLGCYSSQPGMYRALYNDEDKDAGCGQVVTKDKWIKIGMVYTVSDPSLDMIGIEQVSAQGRGDPVDILNIDDVSVLEVDAGFVPDAGAVLPREYTVPKNIITKQKQIAILKLDDLRPNKLAAFDRVEEILDRKGIRAGFGIIADSFETASQEVFDKIKQWDAAGIEIWHHGYYHAQDEYNSAPYEKQLENFKKTMDLVQNKCGITLRTFGSPYNNADTTFIKMVNAEFPEIETLLLVQNPNREGDKLHLNARVNIEPEVGTLSYEKFLEGYTPSIPYLVMQGHPPQWKDADFLELEKIIDFLLAQGVTFMTPHEYYQYERSLKVAVNGERLDFDVNPVKIDDRVLVPMRGIFEHLGAQIAWDDASQTVTGTLGEKTVVLPIGSDSATVNGSVVALDVPAQLVDGRTMVPVRFISESLGAEVLWDEEQQAVFVITQ